MQTLWRDIQYGMRTLGKNPGFAVIDSAPFGSAQDRRDDREPVEHEIASFVVVPSIEDRMSVVRVPVRLRSLSDRVGIEDRLRSGQALRSGRDGGRSCGE
jgi:hypothetical protein